MKSKYFLYEYSDRAIHMIPHSRFPILVLPKNALSK